MSTQKLDDYTIAKLAYVLARDYTELLKLQRPEDREPEKDYFIRTLEIHLNNLWSRIIAIVADKDLTIDEIDKLKQKYEDEFAIWHQKFREKGKGDSN
jgi:hypothetical protein